MIPVSAVIPDSGQVRFSYDNENHTLSYTYLTARALNADFNVVAKSGIGMYRSYGGPIEGTPGNRRLSSCR